MVWRKEIIVHGEHPRRPAGGELVLLGLGGPPNSHMRQGLNYPVGISPLEHCDPVDDMIESMRPGELAYFVLPRSFEGVLCDRKLEAAIVDRSLTAWSGDEEVSKDQILLAISLGGCLEQLALEGEVWGCRVWYQDGDSGNGGEIEMGSTVDVELRYQERGWPRSLGSTTLSEQPGRRRSFVVGDGTTAPGLERALLGTAVGDKFMLSIPATVANDRHVVADKAGEAGVSCFSFEASASLAKEAKAGGEDKPGHVHCIEVTVVGVSGTPLALRRVAEQAVAAEEALAIATVLMQSPGRRARAWERLDEVIDSMRRARGEPEGAAGAAPALLVRGLKARAKLHFDESRWISCLEDCREALELLHGGGPQGPDDPLKVSEDVVRIMYRQAAALEALGALQAAAETVRMTNEEYQLLNSKGVVHEGLQRLHETILRRQRAPGLGLSRGNNLRRWRAAGARKI